jgi:hypothetical protein
MYRRLPRVTFPVRAAGYWVKATDWDQLVVWFREAAAEGSPYFLPHLRFCEQVAGSAYRERIFAITSMHTFILANTAEFDSGAEVLRLDFEDGEAVMEYVEQPGVTARWTRRYPADQAFDAVVRLARRKRWFIEYGEPPVPGAAEPAGEADGAL